MAVGMNYRIHLEKAEMGCDTDGYGMMQRFRIHQLSTLINTVREIIQIQTMIEIMAG